MSDRGRVLGQTPQEKSRDKRGREPGIQQDPAHAKKIAQGGTIATKRQQAGSHKPTEKPLTAATENGGGNRNVGQQGGETRRLIVPWATLRPGR